MKRVEGAAPPQGMMNDVMLSPERQEASSEDSFMTPLERRLRVLEKERQQRIAEGKQETIEQQREYEDLVWQNLVSDLEELREMAEGERSLHPETAGGHVPVLDVLIASGCLPDHGWEKHPILLENLRKIALKKLDLLRQTLGELKLLDGALCLPEDHCDEQGQSREATLHRLEAEWGVN